MRAPWSVLLSLAISAVVARADISGSWRVEFSNAPGEPPQDTCRFDFVESADGQVEGHLGLCLLGIDGVLSGTVDPSGALSLDIVAPGDNFGCEVYGIAATVAPAGDQIEGTWSCPSPPVSGYVIATPCDPLMPGSCPETAGGQSLPPRPHEIRACTPEPAASCQGSSGTRATVTIERPDLHHYELAFKLPDATGMSVADLGDPTTVRDYVACVYHTVGGSPVLAAMEPAWAATFRDDKPCWQLRTTGVSYRNPERARGSLTKLKVKVRPTGRASSLVKGGVTAVTAPPVDVPLGLPVTVQLLADDACLGATFTTATVHEAGRLKAKNGQ
jgi:hypothetical protein